MTTRRFLAIFFRMQKNSIVSLGKVVGSGLAYVSHGIDRLTEWGFHKMKQAGETNQTKKIEPKNKYARGAMKAGQTILGAVGTAGDAYYRTYESLKNKGKD